VKIAHLLAYPGIGGSEKYALYLALEAKKHGHDVLFILGANGPLEVELKKAGIEFRICEMPNWHSALVSKKIGRVLMEKNIDIVHTHHLREHFLAVSAKKTAKKIKVVRTFHRVDRLTFKVKPFYRFYLRKTDAVIAISPYIEKYLIKNGVPKEKIHLISNGVPKISPSNQGEGIGFLGRLVPEKGILEFVNANKTKLGKEYPLYIAGEGPEMADLKVLVSKNDGVCLLGNVTDPTELFRHVSVLVLPSVNEVLPLSILEAFSAGIPVVAFDIAPLSGIVTDANGFKVEVGDYKAMYDAAVTLAGDVKLWAKKSQLATETYESNFRVDKMWVATEDLYQTLLH